MIRPFLMLGLGWFGISTVLAGPWKEISRTVSGVSPVLIEKRVSNQSREVGLTLCQFSTSDFTLRVVDQGNSDSDRRFSHLRDAMEKTGCLAGVNGGFYGKDYRPLGLVVENGQVISPYRNSSGGGVTSGVIWSGTGGIHIVRRGDFRSGPGVIQAIQTGPMLVWQGAIVNGLSSDNPRPRSFFLTDWKRNWMLGTSTSATLAELAEILYSREAITEFATMRAINLDGGRSTGFYLRKEGGQALYKPEISRVRNFIGILPK
ncbi:MAG: phosphodiester glycosidase family protein [Verrucomicrobiota bacterium]